MQLFTEDELQEYVGYWGGDLSVLKSHPYKRGRSLAAVVFYLLHYPEKMPERNSWSRTVKQAVTFLWLQFHDYKLCSDRTFRTLDCKEYFRQLLNGYVECYGKKEVFQFRYQNWEVVDCPTMIDELWTVQEMLKIEVEEELQ